MSQLLAEFRLEGEDVVRVSSGFVLTPPSGSLRYGRVKCCGNKRQIGYHVLKFALGHGWLPSIVDHRDTDHHNNQMANLRAATTATNAMNANRKRVLPRGVQRKDRPKPYQAKAVVDGRLRHLGYFLTAEEASAVVENVLASAHGAYYRKPYG